MGAGQKAKLGVCFSMEFELDFIGNVTLHFNFKQGKVFTILAPMCKMNYQNIKILNKLFC